MPTIEIPDKICSHCGGNKWIVYYRQYKTSTYTKYKCSLKSNEQTKKYRENHPEKTRISNKLSREKYKDKYVVKQKLTQKAYYLRNKNLVIQRSSEWKINNLLTFKKARQKIDKKACLNLTERYIKSLLSDDGTIKYNDVPQELIELKRKQLILTRIIRNNGN
jgi:hypothetical protein